MVALALCSVLVSLPARAQPSPEPPITVAFAHQLGADYIAAQKVLAKQTTFAGRVSAWRDLARVLAKGVEESSGFRLPSEKNADPELKRLVGFGFQDLREQARLAWAACVDEVRKGHGLDEAGRECLEESRPSWIERRYVLAAPPEFTDNPGGAEGSSKLYATTLAELEAKPKSRELARRVGAMALATTDYAAAVHALASVADGYDEAVTLAEAHRALEHWAEAERVLHEAIELQPRRPEAHHALALLLSDQIFASRFQPSTLQNVDAARARAWRHTLGYLCLRDAAVLPAPENAFENAADLAEQLDRGMNGNGSYWSFRSGTTQPLPFLPNDVLPERYQAAPSDRPARNCDQAVVASLRDGEPEPAKVAADPAIVIERGPTHGRPEPTVAPRGGGCAGCVLAPAPSRPAWPFVLVVVLFASLRRRTR
jgi:hypothetical protein